MLEHVTNLVANTKENSKPMKDTNSKIYRESLKQALGCFVAPEVAAAGMAQFDQLAKNGEREQMATEVVLNSLGLKEASAGIVEYVSRELAKLGSAPLKVETDSVKRLKLLVERLKKNIVKGGIVINGQDLSDFAHKQALKSVSPTLQAQKYTYTATGSETVGGKVFKSLAIDTIGVHTE